MEELQTHSGMRRLLDGIAKKGKEYYYLCPWAELFRGPNRDLGEICHDIRRIVLG